MSEYEKDDLIVQREHAGHQFEVMFALSDFQTWNVGYKFDTVEAAEYLAARYRDAIKLDHQLASERERWVDHEGEQLGAEGQGAVYEEGDSPGGWRAPESNTDDTEPFDSVNRIDRFQLIEGLDLALETLEFKLECLEDGVYDDADRAAMRQQTRDIQDLLGRLRHCESPGETGLGTEHPHGGPS